MQDISTHYAYSAWWKFVDWFNGNISSMLVLEFKDQIDDSLITSD